MVSLLYCGIMVSILHCGIMVSLLHCVIMVSLFHCGMWFHFWPFEPPYLWNPLFDFKTFLHGLSLGIYLKVSQVWLKSGKKIFSTFFLALWIFCAWDNFSSKMPVCAPSLCYHCRSPPAFIYQRRWAKPKESGPTYTPIGMHSALCYCTDCTMHECHCWKPTTLARPGICCRPVSCANHYSTSGIMVSLLHCVIMVSLLH